ncbi:MAG TPA: SDR family oxidoreductase, partial [Thermoanaerobaculia bacterium]
ILNASSIVGLYGNFGQTNYAATKAGVISFTKTWSRELGKYKIRVNAVAPGFIATEMVKAMPPKVLESMAVKAPLGTMGEPEDVDLIIVGTDSPDYITPATSVIVQAKLGAKNAGTFDVGCACASFPTALSSAAGMMATNPHLKTVLVIGVYLMHKLTADDDPMIFFYGDGAGAAVLEQCETQGFISSAFRADGSYAPRWAIHAGGTVEPTTEESIRNGRTRVKMYDRYPPEINNEGWPLLVRQVAKNGGFAVNDIDFLIFTQVRKPTIELVMNDLGLPMGKTHMIMETVGYTGSACIPMALDDALQAGKIKPRDLVVLIGSGVGYNQAGVAFRIADDGARLFIK